MWKFYKQVCELKQNIVLHSLLGAKTRIQDARRITIKLIKWNLTRTTPRREQVHSYSTTVEPDNILLLNDKKKQFLPL